MQSNSALKIHDSIIHFLHRFNVLQHMSLFLDTQQLRTAGSQIGVQRRELLGLVVVQAGATILFGSAVGGGGHVEDARWIGRKIVVEDA